jgi:hypothetical protein
MPNPMYELCASCGHKRGHHARTIDPQRNHARGHSCYQGCVCCLFEPTGRYWELETPVAFVHIGTAIMQGKDCVATARSKTFAKRIAHALNVTPSPREFATTPKGKI